MAILLRGGLLAVFVLLGAASVTVAEDPKPCFGRWFQLRLSDGISRVNNVGASLTALAQPANRRRLEEFARDAYFTMIEFKESLDLAHAQDPDPLAGENAQFFYDRGLVRANRGEYDAAISDFNACLRLAPGSGAAYFARGRAWGKNKAYLRGIRDLDRSIRIEPRAVEAYRVRGMYWMTLKDADRAIQDFNQFVRLDATARAHLCRALAWIHESEWGRARRDLERAIRLKPEDAILYFLLGGVRLSTRDDDSAIEAFDRALELSPGMRIAYKGRAIAWARKGNVVKAAVDAASAAGSIDGWTPIPSRCTVRIAVRGEGTRYKSWLDLHESGGDQADYNRTAPTIDDVNKAAAETLSRFRSAAGMREAIFEDRKSLFIPERVSDNGPTISSAPADDGACCGANVNAAQSNSPHGGDGGNLDPRTRRRANALTEQAWLLAASRYEIHRDGVRAVEAAREACELTHWKDAACVEALAAAYAECGDFESADKYQTLAEELAAAGPADIRHAAARRHALYRDRRAVHQGE